MTAYDDDLAYIHDVGYGHFARGATPGLLARLRARGIADGLVIDLGCGSGIWAEALVRAGYQVRGVDISPAMIALARQRVPAARFEVSSFLRAELPPCAAVTSIGECFSYLFDRSNGVAKLVRLFGRIHRALRPGGLLVFDVLQPGHLRGPNPQQRFRVEEDWAVLVEVEEDRARERLTRRITTFRKAGELYRRGHEDHCLRLYRGSELARELRRLGFRVTRLRGYGKLRFAGAHVGFVARKG